MAQAQLPAEHPMTPANYLIVEPFAIVAIDLALCVQDFDGAGTAIIATTPHDAVSVIAETASVRFAFIHADPSGFTQSELGLALAARGAVCVFMGHAADRNKDNMLVLDRPFSPLTVAALLRRLTAPAFT